MTLLGRLVKLGGALEPTPGSYTAPTFSLPWMKGDYQDYTDPLRDESVRANDAILQGITPGPKRSTFELETSFYPDIAGYMIKLIGLFDTVTAGVSSTLAAGSSVGATQVQANASIPAGSVIMLGSGATMEYAQTGTPTGAGPYTLPVTSPALQFAHSVSEPVVSQTTHTFKQNRSFATVWPTLSVTSNDGVDILGWAGLTASELQIKIDPKGLVQFTEKFAGQPSATQSDFTYGASQAQPVPGWGWTVTNAGASSTRGITFDVTLKRSQDIIHGSTGSQAPRDVFPGALEIEGSYKAIFENDTDINMFRKYSQNGTVHTIAQPPVLGGGSLAITMSQAGYTVGEVDNGSSTNWIQLDMNVSGIQNTTDGGVTSMVLKNFVTTAY